MVIDRATRPLLLVMLALCVAGCASFSSGARQVGRDLNPFSGQEVRVVETAGLGDYLLASLQGEGFDLRFFAPMNEDCALLMEPGVKIHYRQYGVFGEVSKGDVRCELSGTASLAAWRDRLGRVPGNAFPRGTARFEEIYRNEDVVLVRGRFPLLSRIRVPAGIDVVAMLPADANCMGLVERGEASLEFRDSGRTPYRLVARPMPCEVLGFAMPPEAAAS